MIKWLSSRTMIMLMIAVLLAGVVAGCSGGGQSSSGGSGGSGQSATGGSSGGSSGGDGGSDADQEPLELNMLLPLFEEVPDMENAWWVEYQKRTNTKLNIEWVPSGDYDTKRDLVLASGDLPDIIWSSNINAPTIQSAIANGAFWELGQFLGDFSEYPNLKEYASPLGWRYLTQDGKIVGVPRFRPTLDEALKIRKDWLDELNMDVPTTMDEYADYLVAAVEHFDDVVGYVHPGGTGIPPEFMAAFGAFEVQRDEDGGIYRTELSPNFLKTVEWMRDVYARGGFPQEFATIKSTQAQELFESGKAASYKRNIWRAYPFQQNIRKIDPNAEVMVINPQGPDGHYALRTVTGIYGAFYLSKAMPEEKVLRILDYFEATNTPEMFDFVYYGIEGVHHEVVDGQKVMTEQGLVEVGTSPQQPLPLAFNNWWKALDKGAPKEYNDALWERVHNWDELGMVNPSEYLVSDTWTNTWPNFQNEWETKVVEAIVGRITLEEYQAYVDSLNNRPEFKQAYQEYAEFYEKFWAED